MGNNIIAAHLSLLGAEIIWGLMAPVGKDAMSHDITGLDMVFFRAAGAALCFWLTALFARFLGKDKSPGSISREHVPPRDLLKLAAAAFFAIVCNQCCFTVGLSITSPINASIVTTTLPIIALISSAIFLRDPVTWKKILGISLGVSGALMLVLGSATNSNAKAGNIVGDLMCVAAQCSFAVYLALFKNLISRYHTVTCMKWMFTFAVIMVAPFTLPEVLSIPFTQISAKTWLETAFVSLGGTFIAYLLLMSGQKTLKPTVVAMYNYVQPITSTVVSVISGLGIFGISQATAIFLIILGVYTVNSQKTHKSSLYTKKTR